MTWVPSQTFRGWYLKSNSMSCRIYADCWSIQNVSFVVNWTLAYFTGHCVCAPWHCSIIPSVPEQVRDKVLLWLQPDDSCIDLHQDVLVQLIKRDGRAFHLPYASKEHIQLWANQVSEIKVSKLASCFLPFTSMCLCCCLIICNGY